ncbi:MAG TPA: acetylglutamate kinase [Bdellovibrionales bacterium]|nr:acetylglutamate kinase [Bdellovibrionales bacterium]
MNARIVIKLGGSALGDAATLGELVKTVRGYRRRGYHVAVVHGGGPAINEALKARGIAWTFINGQRQTTPEMIEVIDEVLSKQVNGRVVEALRAGGIPATGLSGADGILNCVQANAELMQVGLVESVDTSAIENAWAAGFANDETGRTYDAPVPVIAPVGVGARGEKYNVNADWAATKIAAALQAERLLFLTDQKGILDRNKKPLRSATPEVIHQMIQDGDISGGMCTKVLAMMSALNHGVEQVRVLHAAHASKVLTAVKAGTLLVFDTATRTKGVLHEHAS